MWDRTVSPVAALACLTLVAVGCGPRQARLVPAEGVLTIAGEPAADVMVQFMPAESVRNEIRPTSQALTDADGRFKLVTHDGRDGAVEGNHVVILIDATEERSAQGETRRFKSRLNAKYNSTAGGLRAQVAEGGGPIAIDVP